MARWDLTRCRPEPEPVVQSNPSPAAPLGLRRNESRSDVLTWSPSGRYTDGNIPDRSRGGPGFVSTQANASQRANPPSTAAPAARSRKKRGEKATPSGTVGPAEHSSLLSEPHPAEMGE